MSETCRLFNLSDPLRTCLEPSASERERGGRAAREGAAPRAICSSGHGARAGEWAPIGPLVAGSQAA